MGRAGRGPGAERGEAWDPSSSRQHLNCLFLTQRKQTLPRPPEVLVAGIRPTHALQPKLLSTAGGTGPLGCFCASTANSSTCCTERALCAQEPPILISCSWSQILRLRLKKRLASSPSLSSVLMPSAVPSALQVLCHYILLAQKGFSTSQMTMLRPTEVVKQLAQTHQASQ